MLRYYPCLLLLACSEYTIPPQIEVKGVPNPPLLTPEPQEDVITQVTTPQVDILWVMDNSGSMGEEQQKVADNVGAFMQYFLDSGLDYHIGVTTTDCDGNNKGKLEQAAGVRFITNDTPNAIEVFRQLAVVGTNGSADERGRRAAWYALNDPNLNGYNADFYRDDASLHIITISDEHDYSNNDPTIAEFSSWMNALKPDPEMTTYSGIIGPQGGCATAEDGTEYRAVINAVGGIEESICRDDWAPVLEQLGLQAAGLKREYFLANVPYVPSLEVWVEQKMDQEKFTYPGSLVGVDCSSESCFTYEYNPTRNSIVMLDFVPEPLAKVHIKYTLMADVP